MESDIRTLKEAHSVLLKRDKLEKEYERKDKDPDARKLNDFMNYTEVR